MIRIREMKTFKPKTLIMALLINEATLTKWLSQKNIYWNRVIMMMGNIVTKMMMAQIVQVLKKKRRLVMLRARASNNHNYHKRNQMLGMLFRR